MTKLIKYLQFASLYFTDLLLVDTEKKLNLPKLLSPRRTLAWMWAQWKTRWSAKLYWPWSRLTGRRPNNCSAATHTHRTRSSYPRQTAMWWVVLVYQTVKVKLKHGSCCQRNLDQLIKIEKSVKTMWKYSFFR